MQRVDERDAPRIGAEGGEAPASLKIVRLLALVYLLIVTFPGEYVAFRPGNDPSWKWALNELPHTNFLFGRDVVFTSGPLGFLLYPLNLGGHLFVANAFRLGVHALFGFLVYRLFKEQEEPLPILVFTAGYAVVTTLAMPYEFHLLIVFVLLVHRSGRATSRWSSVGYAVAGAAAGAMLFMKITLGFAALATLVAGAGIEVARKRSVADAWSRVVPSFVSWLATLFVLSAIFLRSPANTFRWLRLSLDITTGFNSAMSLTGPEVALVFGLVILFAYAGFLLWMLLGRRPGSGLLLLALPTVAIAFKQAFVRQEDFHVVGFFCVAMAAAAVLILVRRGWRLGVVAFVGVFLLSLPYFQSYSCDCGSAPNVISGAQGITNVRSFLRLSTTRRRLDRKTIAALSWLKLPEAYLSRIRADGGSVDAVPHELSWLVANGLPWTPKPVLQLYSAYTKHLDDVTAAHFAGRSAPRFLLADMRDIDGRYPLWSAPATWRSILENYEVVAADPDPLRPLLLERREAPVALTTSRGSGATVTRGEWVDVPASAGLVYASINGKPLLGALAESILLRTPPVTIEVEFGDGTRATYRFVMANAGNGLLINHLPTTKLELAALFDHRTYDSVRRIRITGAGAFSFQRNFHIEWRLVDYPVTLDRRTTGAQTGDERVKTVDDQ